MYAAQAAWSLCFREAQLQDHLHYSLQRGHIEYANEDDDEYNNEGQGGERPALLPTRCNRSRRLHR